MIPETTDPSSVYTGNDIAYTFDFYFRAIKAADIVVSVVVGTAAAVTLVQNTDYSYTFNNFPNLGGSITLIEDGQSWMTGAALKAGAILTIQYNVAPSQLTNFRTVTPSQLALEIEKQMDKFTMDMLGLQEQMGVVSSTSPAFPDLVGNGGKLVSVKTDETGFEYSTDVSTILAAEDAAILAEAQASASAVAADADRVAAEAAASSSSTYATAAQASQAAAVVSAAQAAQHAVDAGVYAAQADAAAVDAAAQVTLAEDQAVAAAASADEAALAVNLTLYTETVMLTVLDSPYQVLASDNGKLFQVDTTGGNFVFNLPTIQADETWRVSVVKTDSSVNTITVNPYGADTINSAASETITAQIYGHTYYHGLFSNWLSKIFIDNSSFNVGSPGNAGGYAFSVVQNIAAGGTIVPGAEIQQVIKVQGNGGPQIANTAPFSANVNDGFVVVLSGQDDSKILTVLHSDTVDGCILKGDCYLGKDDMLTLVYDETRRRYVELSRSVD